MPQRKSKRRKKNTPTTPPTPTPTPPPPPQMDYVVFQTTVTAVVAQISSNKSEGGNRINSSNQSENQVHHQMRSYKEFMNCKPRTYHGDGGVVTLTRWFEKSESIFEIYAYPNELKVKYDVCTFAESALSWRNG